VTESIRLLQPTFDVVGNLTALPLNMGREVTALAMEATERGLRSYAEALTPAAATARALLGPWGVATMPVELWGWMLNWSAGVLSGYADWIRVAGSAGRPGAEGPAGTEIDLRDAAVAPVAAEPLVRPG
jgi:hypothetical protein